MGGFIDARVMVAEVAEVISRERARAGEEEVRIEDAGELEIPMASDDIAELRVVQLPHNLLIAALLDLHPHNSFLGIDEHRPIMGF